MVDVEAWSMLQAWLMLLALFVRQASWRLMLQSMVDIAEHFGS
jgi:hypothetical protein